MNNLDLLKPFEKIFQDIINSLPTVVGFIAFVLISWIIVKIFVRILNKILEKANIDQLSEKLSKVKIFGNSTINISLKKLVVNIVKWFLIMIFVMAGSEMFGMSTVSNGVKSFFAYLPRLITALAIFGGGVYLGTIVKNAIHSIFKSLDINGGNLVGNIVFYLIVVFLSITALDQAGIDTSIIKSNLTLLLGSILLAFTIAFGLGAKDAITRLLFGYYSRKNVKIGSEVEFDGIEGTITSIDNICVTIVSNAGEVIVPIKDFVDRRLIVKK